MKNLQKSRELEKKFSRLVKKGDLECVYTGEGVRGMGDAAVPGALREQRLEQWITDYSDAILRICFVYLRDRAQAEDALQDTFLKAWKHMDHLERQQTMSEKAWLMRIAINTCHDYHRSKWFRHTDMRRALEDLPPQAMAVLPDDHALLMDVYNLPEKFKQVILLYYYQEMTLAQTAEILAISPSAVHNRLAKAREMLKGRLTGRELDE